MIETVEAKLKRFNTREELDLCGISLLTRIAERWTMNWIRICVAFLFFAVGPPVYAGSYEDGVTAYDKGDYATAAREYRKAAEQGHADAQYILGVMYNFGKGVPENYTEAIKWYRKAAEQGHADAQHNVGIMYYLGLGVPQDDAKAIKWFRKAAVQGAASGQFFLGSMYASGKGVFKSDTEAIKWYRKAAEQGHTDAQYCLGYMYYHGQRVPQNYVQAHLWFNLAASQGHNHAKKGRDLVVVKMTPAQIAEAQELAQKWFKEHNN